MQRRASVLVGVLMVGLFAGASARAVQASEADRLTYVTFSGPVEVPGVGLSAGTYIFKLADPETSRVIQVLSKDGKTVYASFFSRPDRLWPSADGTIVTFHDGLAGAPQAVKTWASSGVVPSAGRLAATVPEVACHLQFTNTVNTSGAKPHDADSGRQR